MVSAIGSNDNPMKSVNQGTGMQERQKNVKFLGKPIDFTWTKETEDLLDCCEWKVVISFSTLRRSRGRSDRKMIRRRLFQIGRAHV